MDWIVDSFDWDEGNIDKVQKHGITIEQIEKALLDDPLTNFDREHSVPLEIRFIAVNKVEEKWIFLSFTVRIKTNQIVYRVISARYAREKEVRRIYEKEAKKKIQKK